MRQDFRVLSAVIDKPTWMEEVAAAYGAGDYNGVHLRVKKGLRVEDLGGLEHLPGIQYLEVDGRVVDDTAAFGLESLRELVLLTRCEVPIPAVSARNLRRFGSDDRPGKESLVDLPELRSLLIWSWRDPDFKALEGAQGLITIHVEGYGQTVSLEGIEGCLSLREIELDAICVDNLRPLRALRQLRKVWIVGRPSESTDVVLDLSDVAQLPRLEELRLTFAGAVRSVEPLLRLGNLRDLRLRGTRILDSDEVPLSRLAERVGVVFPND